MEANARRFEYLWQDSENYKKPTKMPAPAYIEQLMTWVQSSIDNEAVLPSKIGMIHHASCSFDGFTDLQQACRSPSRSQPWFARSSSACTEFTRTFTATITL